MKKGYLLYIGISLALVYFLVSFLSQHVRMLFSRQAFAYLIQGRWDVALLYIVFFSTFLFFLNTHPIKKTNWKSHSVYTAFIIALFAEMFGFPLSVFFLSSFTQLPAASPTPYVIFESSFLGMQYHLELNTFVGLIVSFIALALIIVGWKKIYKSKKLVTDGIYNVVRHPQYLGILLIVSVWALVWPTLLTLIMWPILIIAYYKLARKEEKEMSNKFGAEYEKYMKRVPMMLPFLNWK